MKEKIAELEKQHCICGPEYTDRGLISPDCRSHEFAADVRDFLKNIQVEVECPDAGRHKDLTCPCKGTGKIHRLATPEDMEKGGILKIK